MAGRAVGLKRFVTEFVQWPEAIGVIGAFCLVQLKKHPGIVQCSWFHCARKDTGAQTSQHMPNSQGVKKCLRGVYITQPGEPDMWVRSVLPCLVPRSRRMHYFFQHSLILIADVGIGIKVRKDFYRK